MPHQANRIRNTGDEQREFYALSTEKQAKQRTKAPPFRTPEVIQRRYRRKIFFLVVRSTGNSPVVNRFSTPLARIG
jgi:hypothetical protein